MCFKNFRENLRAIPEENRERFQKAMMNQLPVLVRLICLFRTTINELYWHFVEPSDKDLVQDCGYEEDDLYWTPLVDEVMDECEWVEGLLSSMLRDVGVSTRQVADADDTPSLKS